LAGDLHGGYGLHLRYFVATTNPKSSLIHNLKSVPWALTGTNLISGGVEERQDCGERLLKKRPGRQPHMAQNIGSPNPRCGFGALG
jgi:hypothetical protein